MANLLGSYNTSQTHVHEFYGLNITHWPMRQKNLLQYIYAKWQNRKL